MNKIASFLVCLMMVMTLSSCTAKDAIQPQSSNSDDASSNNTELNFNNEKKPDVSRPSSLISYDPQVITVDKKNIHSMTDTSSYDEVSFSNFKISQSDTLPEEIDKEDFKFLNSDYENDVLKDEHTFMFVTHDVTNITNEKQNYYLNGSYFVELDENLELTDIGEEARYILGGDVNGGDDKDTFVREVKANETITVTTGYFIEDKLANSDSLYFALFIGTHSGNLKAVKVEKGDIS